jgi:hypothetical protein
MTEEEDRERGRQVEEKFFEHIDYRTHIRFYKPIIPNNNDTKYYKIVEQIMNTVNNFETILNINESDTKYYHTIAAANFARKMTRKETDNFYIYCAYFEFAYAEFKRNYFIIEVDHPEDPYNYFVNHFFDGQLIKKNTTRNISDISRKAFKILEGMYNYYENLVKEVVKNFKIWVEFKTEFDEFNQVRKMARFNQLEFSSDPSNVYHWRKHYKVGVSDYMETISIVTQYRSKDNWEDMKDFHKQSIKRYFIEANEVVNKGFFTEYVNEKTFEFKITVNRYTYKYALVKGETPYFLITYYENNVNRE